MRETALPPGTLLRFAVLSATLFAATASIYRRLGQLLTDADAKMAACLNGTRLNDIPTRTVPGFSGSQGSIDAVLGCSTDMPGLILQWSGTGLLLTAVGTWLLLRMLPALSVWHRKLKPFDPNAFPRTDARLRSAEARLGLPVRPVYWSSANFEQIEGRAFGTSRRPQVSLTQGLMNSAELGLADAAIDATVLHELAHVARRDVGRTYLAVASWWVFVAVTVVPFLVTTAWLSAGHPAAHETRPLLTVAALIALVHAARTGVLRNREFAADAVAADLEPAAVASALADASSDGTGPGWFRWHPPRSARQAALLRPSLRFRPPVGALFLVGVTIGIITTEVAGTLTFLLGLPDGVRWARAVNLTLWIGTIGVMAGTLVLTGRRSWTARRLGDPHLSLLRPGFALAAGVVLGEPLSISSAEAGVGGTIGVHGLTLLRAEIVSGLVLAVLLAGACAWGTASAAVTGPSPGRLRRRWPGSATVGPVLVSWVGVLLPVLAWSVLHRLPLIGQFRLADLGSPSPLSEDGSDTFLGPFRSWVASEYFPLQAISFRPWYAISIALPFVLWTVALAASPGLRPALRTAFRAAALGIAAYTGTALAGAVLIRYWLHGWYLNQQPGPARMYFLYLDTRLVVVAAAVVAVLVAARWPLIGPVLGTVAALITAVGSAVVTPALIIAAVHGFPHVLTTVSDPELGFTAYGLVSMSTTVQTVLLCFPLAVISGTVADRRRRRPASRVFRAAWGYLAAGTMTVGIVAGAAYGFAAGPS